MKEVEPNIWLNIVLTHPDTLYGQRAAPDSKEESETIANTKFHASQFREEDSRIFYRLLDAFHSYFLLFHGSLRGLYQKQPYTFEGILDDFTRNFEFHFFAKEFERNFFWNLEFQGLFYCPIDKKQFLQTQLLADDVEQVLVFHDDFYISSTLPHEDIQPLYSYLVGCGETTKEFGSGFKPLKVHTYKEAGTTFRVRVPGGDGKELFMEETDDYAVLGVSNFGKINPRAVGQLASAKSLQYVIGPHFERAEEGFAEVFAPKVYIK